MKMKSMFKKIKYAAFALIIFAVAASINLFSVQIRHMHQLN